MKKILILILLYTSATAENNKTKALYFCGQTAINIMNAYGGWKKETITYTRPITCSKPCIVVKVTPVNKKLTTMRIPCEDWEKSN